MIAPVPSVRVSVSSSFLTWSLVSYLRRTFASRAWAAQERAQVIEALDQFLDDQVTPLLSSVALPSTLVGAGGTPVFLSRILKETDDLDAAKLETLSWLLPDVQSLTDRLWMMSLERRQSLAGLPADRADVILFGAAIYEAVMMRCGFHELRPTMRGVRYGSLLS